MPWTTDTVAVRGPYSMRHVTTKNRFPGEHELEEGYEIPSWMERGTEMGVDPDTGEALTADMDEPAPAKAPKKKAKAKKKVEPAPKPEMDDWNDPLPMGDPEA